MNPRLVKANYEDCLFVAQRMREWDRREIFATQWTESPEDLAALCQRVPELSYTVWLDEPVAAFGAVQVWPGVFNVWFFATDRIREIGRWITRFMVRVWIPLIGEAAAPHMHKLIVNGDARFSIDVVTSLAMGNSSQATKETVTELLLATPKESRGVGWKGAIQFIGTLSDRPEVTIPALLKLAREDKSVATECITAITRQPFGVSVRPIRRAFPEVMPILMQMEPAKRDPLFVGLVNVLPQADIYGLVRRFGVLKVEDLVKVFEDEKMRRELVEYMLEDKNF